MSESGCISQGILRLVPGLERFEIKVRPTVAVSPCIPMRFDTLAQRSWRNDCHRVGSVVCRDELCFGVVCLEAGESVDCPNTRPLAAAAATAVLVPTSCRQGRDG